MFSLVTFVCYIIVVFNYLNLRVLNIFLSKRSFLIIVLLSINVLVVKSNIIDPPFLYVKSNKWVDSIMTTMSLEEKIGQFFMVAAYSNKDQKHINEISNLIQKYKIGGLIFFQGGPVRQAKQTNYYQSISKIPLLIGFDGEWGLAMRIDSTIAYPRQMILGAVKNNDLIYEMGKEVARQCKRIGVHINFAPVIDVNNNSGNPVIGTRSFGEDKKNVAVKGYAYMLGMQDNRVLAVGKHFPGHGDTDTDSHFTLPIINSSKERLDTLELYPFKQLINRGIGGIMVAHLFIPAIDTTTNLPSTLSKKIVTGLLKEELDYKGLIFTDALNMKGVSSFYEPGVVEAKALLAGNDVLLFAENVPVAINQIKKYIDSGQISIADINARCRKILQTKYWAGLNHCKPVVIDNIYTDLNTPYTELLKIKLIENSLTVLKNEKGLIPLKRLDTLKIASVVLGAYTTNNFQEKLSLYTEVTHFNFPKYLTGAQQDSIVKLLSSYNLIIVGVHGTNAKPSQNYGVVKEVLQFVDKLADKLNVIVDLFGNPYLISQFTNISKLKSLVLSYADGEITQSLSAQLIFGGVSYSGKIPISASSYKEGSGKEEATPIRFKYSIPEEVGMDSKTLLKIDSLALNAIKEKAFPGCQVLVAKDGVVVYQKSFGTHTYSDSVKVINTDIYDIASVTKIVSSTLSLMKLKDEGKFDLKKKLSDYIPTLKKTNKKDILIEDILTHQGQLTPWIPFYLTTIKNEDVRGKIYSMSYSDKYPVQVAENMYIAKYYRDSIFSEIKLSKILARKEYKYSDLGFYYFQDVIEKQSRTKLNNYVENNFYKKIGATTMGYLPLKRFPKSRIIPTENDTVFRKQLLQGYVHDPGAAMLGGVAGHAGIFSNANDLAKIMQMYLNEGEYGGVRYIKPETIKLFTSSPFAPGNRRALGFDKPEINTNKVGPTCKSASNRSFGHTGFTGTMTWVDPEKNLVYVFLSNRVNPDQNNQKYIELHVRTKIQEVIYDSIK